MPNRKDLPVINMHVPKTGGTSLLVLFHTWFGKNIVRKNDYPRETDYHRKVLSGHFPYNPDYWDFNWVSFVRHPIARLESFYRYKTAKLRYRYNPLNDDYWAKFIYQKTMEEWLESHGSKNLITKQFAGKRPWDELDDTDFEKAIKAVDNFWFIGLQERYTEDVLILAEMLGVQHDGDIPHRLRTAERVEKTYDNLYGNQLDMELYNYVKDKRGIS